MFQEVNRKQENTIYAEVEEEERRENWCLGRRKKKKTGE